MVWRSGRYGPRPTGLPGPSTSPPRTDFAVHEVQAGRRVSHRVSACDPRTRVAEAAGTCSPSAPPPAKIRPAVRHRSWADQSSRCRPWGPDWVLGPPDAVQGSRGGGAISNEMYVERGSPGVCGSWGCFAAGICGVSYHALADWGRRVGSVFLTIAKRQFYPFKRVIEKNQ